MSMDYWSSVKRPKNASSARRPLTPQVLVEAILKAPATGKD
jgi:hypothetical protein